MLHRRKINLEQLSALADGGYVFAIVDACVAPKAVMRKADDLGEARALSLFHGTELQEYYGIAPYLFSVDRGILDWITRYLGDANWGVLAVTKATREALAAHLQRFFHVLLPDGHKWFFRYYDPVILETYLPSCRIEELRQFFGPVRGFAILDGEQQSIQIFECVAAVPQQPLPATTPPALWQVRADQVQALSQGSRERFVKELAAHLREHFPKECSMLSDADFPNRIRLGIQCATAYGITTELENLPLYRLGVRLGARIGAKPTLPPLTEHLERRLVNRPAKDCPPDGEP